MLSKTKLTATLLAALMFGAAGAASARDRHDHGRDHGRDQGRHSHAVHHHSDHRGPPARVVQRRFDPHHGHAHHRHFSRGERLPVMYRGQSYVVNDWRGHRLQAPPRGHHWVQVGRDQMLVAIATGVITQLILAQ